MLGHGAGDDAAATGHLKVQEERQQWEKAHKIMKDSPPTGGRDYLMHARNLLLLLEGIAEIHPVSKVVVSSFKTIVMFETDRRDNDVRVTAVFLAQTDTMQILLDIDDISVRQRDREDLKGLRSNAMLGSLLETVTKDIKECGNTIDAYYKESRFVKFWKSQDWKGRMLDYVDVFSRHRTHLQQIISVQVAAGVGDLVSKMDEVLSRLYRPKSQWERDLDSETRRLGDPTKWMDDQNTLRDLISMTDDPAFPLLPTSTSQSKETGAPLAYYTGTSSEQARRADLESSLIERIRGKLSLSLDVICERNMDRFELKLNFYMLQMQEAIQESTQTIVHALSGPFDRLEDKDLRELWKEMDWIFCVENKLFSSALFEYYLDLFSTRRVDMSSSAQTVEKDASYLVRSKWDKSGSIKHVDSWTLDYLVAYGVRIAAAIDDDGSGFIRISEANAFTRKMPFGWNLPQWCAYSAVGWLFEARIYRKRINRLLFKLKEAHIEVLPANRTWAGFSITGPITADICGAFWREPRGISKPSISLQLKDLVKDKILSQDVALRSKLSSLKWTIDAASTIDILFGETPVESFILQLIAIMLEYVLEVVFICSKATLDVREWERIIATFEVMRQTCVARVESLKGQTSEQDGVQLDLDLEQFCGGIWSHFDAQRNMLNRDISKEVYYDFWRIYSANIYTVDDYRDFISDSSFLDNFSLPSPSDVNPYLEYRPWEEVTQNMATEDVPSVIPNSWDASGGSLSEFSKWEERITQDNINYGWYCNQCGADEPQDQRYHCAECLDIDFCGQCFTVSKEDCRVQHHEPHHPLIIVSFNLMPHQVRILEAEAKHHLDEVQYFLRGRHLPGSPTNNISNESDDLNPGHPNPAIPDVHFVCEMCSQDIALNSVFYKCIGNPQCKNVFLCEVCAKNPEDRGYIQHHKWWHHLLVLRSDILEKSGEAQAASLPVNALNPDRIPSSVDELKDATASASTAIAAVSDIQATFEAKLTALEDSLKSNTAQIDERIAGLEKTLNSSNSMLEERMSKLESKMDDMMDKLQEWFTNARRT